MASSKLAGRGSQLRIQLSLPQAVLPVHALQDAIVLWCCLTLASEFRRPGACVGPL